MMTQPAPPSSHILKDLTEITLPEAVGWWPQTIGWQILGILALIFLLLWGVYRYRLYHFNRYRREALRAITTLELSRGRSPSQPVMSDLFLVLKVTAAHVQPELASHMDRQFLRYLDTSASLAEGFDSPVGLGWLDTLVQPETTLSDRQMQQLLALAHRWVIRHRNPNQPRLLWRGR
ncbi:DUF4381 domain-containing protein [Photobacterium sp. GJ3]|uniref:DUF4381 domain-containing protein n=1 Tax=Photobacterium sp. GJ3 TaxID=2829502 RepID=UPI001B8D49DB|nr:DUF4381 domain-containing protein [Photobacterium sp. GJ3]QUJ68341.1 DUF4381 domain-containing protein [Photobacterium sp. GJ3]